jgi:phage terminase large subunit-like protein
MAKPPSNKKTLDEHLREGTFVRSRHQYMVEELGASVDQWRSLSVRSGGELKPADHFEKFASEMLRHTVGRWYGQPFTLEPWQRELLGELLAVDKNGRRKIRQALIGLPRKNGKSSLLSALALWAASVEGEQSPDVVVAAGSRDQAAVVFDQARAFASSDPLLDLWFDQQRYTIKCPDSNGVIRRVAADGKLVHGLNPGPLIVCDELHSWQTPRQEELWAALQTATGAREEPLTVTITTAGFNKATILGRLYDEAVKSPKLEEREDGSLLVVRDDDFLLWWYTVPESVPVDDESFWQRANPASWIDNETLRSQLESPTMDENTFARLHLNRWVKARNAWLPAGVWDEMRDPDLELVPGQEIYVAVDVGLVHDSTAVVVSWPIPDSDKVALKAHIWSAVEDAPAHSYCAGGRIDLGEIEAYIRQLAETYDLRELVFDPRFFERSAQELASEGIRCAPIIPASSAMQSGYSEFYAGAMERRIVHDGDPVLASHVEATAARRTERGWKIQKLETDRRIDGLVASVMAHWRAWRSVAETDPEGFVLI